MKQLGQLTSFLIELLREQRFVRARLAVVVLISVASGACAALLVGVINSFLSHPRQNAARAAQIFAALLAGRILLRFAAQYLVIRLGQTVVLEMRSRLCRQILATPLRRLEELGTPRLTTALMTDLGQISQALVQIPAAFINVTMLTGFLAYLGWLDPVQLFPVAAIAAAGYFTFRPALRTVGSKHTRSRELYDKLAKFFRSLTEGAKELKMNSRRREAFAADIETVAHSHQREARSADIILAGLGAWSEGLFYAAVAYILFISPLIRAIDQRVLIGYAVTVLMMRPPIEGLLGALPSFSEASVAIRKLAAISASVHPMVSADRKTAEPDYARQCHSLELVGIRHRYRGADEMETFRLMPANLAFSAGELTFVTGGNGSGKTTLAKILAGLYAPEAGEVRLDGITVTDDNRDWYRQHVSSVFSDFFLFDALYGVEASDSKSDMYLRRLALSEKVRIHNGCLSTVDLSQGQRKRLALLVAYLEDRPICVFDEWAADQDPQFKRVFYETLLPELRSQGKIVIVINHDEHYYHSAERIIKLTAGEIEFDGPLAEYTRYQHGEPRSIAVSG